MTSPFLTSGNHHGEGWRDSPKNDGFCVLHILVFVMLLFKAYLNRVEGSLVD